MNTKYNELEDRYEVDPQSIVRSELLNVETPNKYVTYAGLERAVKNVLSKAKDYDKGLVGGYNGSFPLTAATKGNIYLLPATKKYYVCITEYSGSQLTAPNANFEELSVYTNRSKLDNLKAIDVREKITRLNSYIIVSSAFIVGDILIINITSSGSGSALYLDTIFKLNTELKINSCSCVLRDSTGNNTVSLYCENGTDIVWRSSSLNWSSGSLMGVLVTIIK